MKRADSYFSYGEFMTVFAKTVAERTRPGVRQDIEEKSYTFHVYGSSASVCGIIISDAEYPALVAHQLLSKIVDEFTSQNPRSSYTGMNAQVTSKPMPTLKPASASARATASPRPPVAPVTSATGREACTAADCATQPAWPRYVSCQCTIGSPGTGERTYGMVVPRRLPM